MGSAGVLAILIRKPPFENRLVKQGRRRFRALVTTPIEGKSFGPHWEVLSDFRSGKRKGGKWPFENFKELTWSLYGDIGVTSRRKFDLKFVWRHYKLQVPVYLPSRRRIENPRPLSNGDQTICLRLAW